MKEGFNTLTKKGQSYITIFYYVGRVPTGHEYKST